MTLTRAKCECVRARARALGIGFTLTFRHYLKTSECDVPCSALLINSGACAYADRQSSSSTINSVRPCNASPPASDTYDQRFTTHMAYFRGPHACRIFVSFHCRACVILSFMHGSSLFPCPAGGYFRGRSVRRGSLDIGSIYILCCQNMPLMYDDGRGGVA